MRLPSAPLVLGLALLACGDDDPGGTGGSGGGSTAAATSGASGASTTTAGPGTGGGPGSGGDGASSSASGGGGQGAGGDGSGAGGGAGTGGASPACAGLGEDAPAVTVLVVDETGAPVAVDTVVWQPEPADPFWLEASEASCAGGGSPPCSTWEIEGPLEGRIAISSERETDAEPTRSCMPYASAFVQVHPPREGEPERQLVHLTLPSDGTFCLDGTGVNHEHDEQVDEADCLAAPAPPPASAAIVLGVVDQDGEPVPATIANWYYPPKGPDYDGEHPLACADQRCETWVVTDTPRAGTIYLNASYAGPLNPYFQTGWSGYDGAPFEVELDDGGAIVPISAELQVDTDVESAIGG